MLQDDNFFVLFLLNIPECDVNCHKKCERLTANLCGVNQKLIVEALANVKRGKRAIQTKQKKKRISKILFKYNARDKTFIENILINRWIVEIINFIENLPNKSKKKKEIT